MPGFVGCAAGLRDDRGAAGELMQADYDQVAAALKDSETILAGLLAEPRKQLAEPPRRLERPR